MLTLLFVYFINIFLFTEANIDVNTTEIDVSDASRFLPNVLPGGADRPIECKARSRVAIVVAFRDRLQHLGIFLRHLHPFLHRQLLDYRIFIIQMVSIH